MVPSVSRLLPLLFAALIPTLPAQVVPSPPEELLRGLVEPLPSAEGLSCALADLDGDGFLDAVTVEPTTLSVLFGRGDASFGARHTVPLNVTTAQHWPDSGPRDPQPIVADMNHDGELDVLVLQRAPSTDARVLFLAGRGGGRLDAGVTALELEGLRAADVGDVDGDGRLDLVLVRTLGGVPVFFLPPLGPTALFVALGNGDGSFKPPVQLPLLGAPQGDDPVGPVDHVFVADVDADGHLDVVTDGLARLITYRGTGAGSFEDPQILNTNDTPFDVALADLDADGDLDLVASSTYSNITSVSGKLRVHRWDAGAFGPAEIVPLDDPSVYSSPTGPIAVGDFDGDGHVDVFCSGWDGSIPHDTLVPGDGLGGFGAPRSFDMPALRSIAAGDLDGNGTLDLIACGGAPNLIVSRNAGGAEFATAATPFGGSVFGGEALLRGTPLVELDVDRDGDTDLVALGFVNSLPALVTVRNDGSGMFSAVTDSVPLTRQLGILGQVDLEPGDLNGDGVTDLALSQFLGDAVFSLLGGAPEPFSLRHTLALNGDAGPLTLGDIDLDGDLDAAVGEGTLGALVLLEGDGTGQFTRRATLRRSNQVQDVALADLDHDGVLELLSVHGDGVGLEVARGAGGFVYREPERFAASRDARGLLLADLDGDTLLDAVTTDAHSPFAAVLPGAGGARFAAAMPLRVAASPAQQDGEWPVLTLADIDADGLLDLVSRSVDGVVLRLREAGGGFAPLRVAAVNTHPFTVPLARHHVPPAIADFDGDGDLDVATGRNHLLRDAVIVENLLEP